MIKFSEILGRSCIENSSEFYLMLCVAADISCRGSKLDVSDIRVNAKDITDDLKFYYKYLRFVGALYESDSDVSKDYIDPARVKLYVNMQVFMDAEDILVDETSDSYLWNNSMLERYRTKSAVLGNISNVGKILMHLVGHFIVSEYIGERKQKPIRVSFDNIFIRNLDYYMHLYILERSWSGSSKYIKLDIDFLKEGIDIEYQLFCKQSMDAGNYRLLSVKEKLEKMSELGIGVGSIVIMYARSNLNASNLSGKISGSIIARIDEVGDDYIGYLTIPLNRTKEEIKLDYESMSDTGKEIYGNDMLSFHISTRMEVSNLYSIGIGDCFYTEDILMELINPNEKIEKMVTIDGTVSSVEMSEIDAIYWLLCQFDIPFDRELYRMMYSEGKDLLWDVCADESEECFDTGNF